MILTPSSAVPGTTITVSGRAARKRSTRIRIDGTLALGFTTGGAGTYNRTVTVPSRPAGTYPVTLEQLTDAWRQVDHTEITVKAAEPIPEPVPVPPPPPAPPPPPTETWTFGASEGGTFTVPPNTRVRYGAGTTFVEKVLSGQVACTNATFGDPVPNVVKHCDYIATASEPIPPSPNPTVPDGLASGAKTLQQVVNEQPAGSTFGVPPRTFPEQVALSKTLHLVSVGPGPWTIDGGMARPYGLVITGPDVIVEGPHRVTNCRTPFQQGAVRAMGTRTILRGGRYDHNGRGQIAKDGGAGVELRGSSVFSPSATLEDCELDYNAEQGWAGSGPFESFTLRRVKVHHNNPNAINDGYNEGGAGKTGHFGQRVTIEDSEIHDNQGPGAWSDIRGDYFFVKRNKLWDNSLSAIFFEISQYAEIEDNSLWANGKGDVLGVPHPGWNPNHGRGWLWSGQILVSSSAYAKVLRNVMAFAPRGISFINQNRYEYTLPNATAGMEVRDNIGIAFTETSQVVERADDQGKGWPGWVESGSRYFPTVTAEAKAILEARGMPIAA